MASSNNENANEKVGSSVKAIHQFGGKGDFGTPARNDVVREREGDIEGRPAGSAPGNTGAGGNRTTGVGSAGGEPGHDSGGDLDTDFIGFGAHGGLAAKPVKGHTDGPDDAGDPSDTFAGGDHAAGKGNLRPGTHGASPRFKGDTVDHSGSDASTINPDAAGSVKSAKGDVPGAEGEITMDEATGSLNQGAEP